MIHKIIIPVLLSGLLASCENPKGIDISLNLFIYPKENQTYKYTVTDGSDYTIYGEKENSHDSIDVIEEIWLEGENKNFNVKVKQNIYHDSKSIIRVINNEEEIIFKKPLIEKSTSWSRKAEISSLAFSNNNKKYWFNLKENKYICNINKIYKKEIFSSSYTIIRVRCDLEGNGNTILVEEYAAGLGMYSRILESYNNSGKKLGEFREELTSIHN